MDFLIPTDKFHKIVFIKQYIRKLKPEDQTIRNLLCYYLSLVNQKYKTIKDFSFFLAKSYSLNFRVNLSNIGCYSIIEYYLSCVDPKYLNDEFYNINFLENTFEDITKPLIKKNKFDKKIFNKAKNFYLTNLLYEKENEDQNAYNGLINAYFLNTDRCFISSGDIDSLNKITLDDLYNYYLSILEDEQISYVTGDVFKLEAKNNSTLKIKNDYFFTKRTNSLEYIFDKANTKQAQLFIIYDHQTYSNDKLFYALCLLNRHFGGENDSKLFKRIREELSLCYAISTTNMGSTGIILLKALINKKDEEKVLKEIDYIYNHLLDDFDLDKMKNYYKFYYKDKLDYINTLYREFLYENYFINTPTIKKEIEMIDSITLDDINKAYKKMKKTLIYVYGGDDE